MRTILAAVLMALSFSVGDAQIARPERGTVLRVPQDFRTIQEAIDAALDNATIVLERGVYDAGPSGFVIEGKRVNLVGRDNPEIRGAEPDRERLRDLTRAAGLLNFRAGGGGSVKGLVLTGGDNAIVGLGREQPPGALSVLDTKIQGSGRGILWCCAALTVQGSHMSNLAWHGISIPCGYIPLHALIVNNLAIVDSEQAGIYMCDSPGTATCLAGDNIISNASLSFNKGGGILAVNSQLCVKDSNIDFATTAGMIFLGSVARVRNNDINFSKFLDPAGQVLGDGILTWTWQGVQPSVTIENGTIYHVEGFALRNFGGQMAIGSALMYCSDDENAIVTAPMDGFTDSLTDLGGALCGCPFANSSCLLANGGAPPPPQPIGGLE